MSEAVADALGVNLDLLRQADAKIKARTLEPNEVLVQKGDPVDDVFVILRGSVEVLGFDDQPLAVLDAGSVVGEIAVLAGGSRTATVRSIDATEVASLDAESFERLISVASELYERVSTEAIRRLDHRWLMEFISWLLGPVEPHVGDEIAQAVAWRRIRAGDYVYREGEPAASGFSVIRGRIRITGSDRLAESGSLTSRANRSRPDWSRNRPRTTSMRASDGATSPCAAPDPPHPAASAKRSTLPRPNRLSMRGSVGTTRDPTERCLDLCRGDLLSLETSDR